MPIQQTIARRIREERERVGITQGELAEKVGVTGNSVWRWEPGAAFPRADDIDRLGEALGIQPEHLLGEPRPPTPAEALEVLRLALHQPQPSPLERRALAALSSLDESQREGYVRLIEQASVAVPTDESGGTQDGGELRKK